MRATSNIPLMDSTSLEVLQEFQKNCSSRATLRQENAPERVERLRTSTACGQGSSGKLKSDIKKTSAFVKKLKLLSESNFSTLQKDILELNLTRYISECVAAIVEAPFKMADLPVAIELISLLHQRYQEFTSLLLQTIVNVFDASHNVEDKQKMIKRRILLRLLAEMYLVDVYDDVSIILSILQRAIRRDSYNQSIGSGSGSLHFSLNATAKSRRNITSSSSSSANNSTQFEIPLLVSFAKFCGLEFFGVVPRKFKDTISRSNTSQDPKWMQLIQAQQHLVPENAQSEALNFYIQAFETISKYYENQHLTVCKLQNRNEKEELNCGEVNEKHAEELEKAKNLFEKVQTSLSLLAEAIDRDMPALPKPENEGDKSETGLLVYDGAEHRSADSNHAHKDSPFSDEDTRSLYEDLPNLLDLVPAVVLGLTEQEVLDMRKKQENQDGNKESTNDPTEEELEVEEAHDEDSGDESLDLEPEDLELERDEIAEKENKVTEAVTKDESTLPTSSSSTIYHHQADTFFTSLDSIVNRERCDKAAAEFCYINSKSNRNRLIKHVFNVPRTHLELLVYYARLIATLNRVLKDDLGQELVELLVSEFNYFIKKRNQFRLESRIKNIRFLAELVKFQLCPASAAFRCLKKCFSDFQGQNVSVATTLLENCGRFLYCCRLTHVRTVHFLSIMMKLKSAKHLDAQAETLIQNAFYLCQPPLQKERVVKQHDPLYLFIQKLLYQDLSEENLKRVTKLLRKLPWKSKAEETRDYVIKAILKVTTGKVMHMPLVVDVLKELAKFYPQLSVWIIDDVLEAIHQALDVNDYRRHQKTLGYAKLLGELYNRGFIGIKIIMDTLYLIIHHSHDLMTLPQYAPYMDYLCKLSIKHAIPNDIDPPSLTLAKTLHSFYLVPQSRYDPRVPSSVDSSTDVFRIRLVCTLIESCGTSAYTERESTFSNGLEKGLQRIRLKCFMVFFQRYILSKDEIPLETDFVIIELFESLTRAWKDQFVRYETWEEADTEAQKISATQLQETEKRQSTKLTRDNVNNETDGNAMRDDAGSKHSSNEASKRMDNDEADSREDEDEDEDEDDDDEEDDEEDEDAQDLKKGDVAKAVKGEVEEEAEDDVDDEEDQIIENEDDNDFVIRDRYQRNEEDELFEQAYKSMVQSSVEPRKSANRINVDKMAIPTMIKTVHPSYTDVEGSTQQGKQGTDGVVYKMLRRGNKGKVEARCLIVPEQSSLAQHCHRQENAGRREQSELKRLVLQNIEREELQDTFTPMFDVNERFPLPSSTRTTIAAPPTQLTADGRATFGQSSEWNNAEFGLRRGRNYRGGR